jgi:acetyl-CoA synthetase
VLKSPASDEAGLLKQLSGMIVAEMGKPLAPKAIHIVCDLPKTRNAKIMRRVIRSTYLNQPPGDLSSLENAQAVEKLPRQT